MRETTNPPSLPTPVGYSQIVRVTGGTTAHISGQVAWDADGNLVGESDFEAQTRQVFSNLRAAVEAAGAELANLIEIGIYVVDHDVDKLVIIRRVRDELFVGIDPPASTLLGVSALALPELMIEVDAIVYLPE